MSGAGHRESDFEVPTLDPAPVAANLESFKEKRKAINSQKDQLSVKLKQKLKKLNKQQDLGNKQFREVAAQIEKLFDSIRDKLDDL